ncbi:MAG: hypothetical protein FD137_1421, partial [Spirochaetes bacterium]
MARKSLIIAAGIFFAGFAAILLGILLLPRLPPVADFVIAKVFSSVDKTIQDATGLKANYAEATLHSLGHVSLSGLSLLGEDDSSSLSGKAPLLNVSTLDVHFNLRTLVFGPREEGVERIAFGTVALALSRAEAKRIADRLAAYLALQPKSKALPRLSITVESLSLYLASVPAAGLPAASADLPGASADLPAAGLPQPNPRGLDVPVSQGPLSALDTILPDYAFTLVSREIEVSTLKANYHISFPGLSIRADREVAFFPTPSPKPEALGSSNISDIQRFLDSVAGMVSSAESAMRNAFAPGDAASPGSKGSARRSASKSPAPATPAAPLALPLAPPSATKEPLTTHATPPLADSPDVPSSALPPFDLSGVSISLSNFSATVPQDLSRGSFGTVLSVRKNERVVVELPVDVSVEAGSVVVG